MAPEIFNGHLSYHAYPWKRNLVPSVVGRGRWMVDVKLDAEGWGRGGGAKRVGEGRVRRLFRIHELAHRSP